MIFPTSKWSFQDDVDVLKLINWFYYWFIFRIVFSTYVSKWTATECLLKSFEIIPGSLTKAKLEIRAEQTQKSNSKWFSFKYWSHYWPHPSKTGSFSQSESFIHHSLSNHLSFEITQFWKFEIIEFLKFWNRVGF